MFHNFRALLGAFAVAVGLLVAAPSASAQSGGRVAILGAEPNATWRADVASKVLADGRFIAVDNIDVNTTTPSLATLQTYKAVLVFSDGGFQNAVALGNNLDAYVRAGGGVVNAVFEVAGISLGGAWNTNAGTAIATGAAVGTATLGAIAVPGHPTISGVTTFNGGQSSYRSDGAITTGATLIASWSSGQPLVAIKPVGAGTVVSLNFFPPSNDVRADFWAANTNGGRLMANALVFAGGNALPAPVPTLSEWAMILLGLAMAGGAALYIQRRQFTV